LCCLGRMTIEALPDDVLLDIFYFSQDARKYELGDWFVGRSGGPLVWHTLVHVCQRWRHVVLASPIRLKLLLVCTGRTPVTKMLHVWPSLPIVVRSRVLDSMDNIISALKHHDRVQQIFLALTSTQMEGFVTVMQEEEAFPALTRLQLQSFDMTPPRPPLPETFLVGSAPRLQFLRLDGIPFPTLPKLLLTTSDLVDLTVWRVPDTGYITPEAMVTALSALTRLESLTIRFQSPASRPDPRIRRPPPLAPVILPSLTYLSFEGVSEYLEHLVAQIDAPHLKIFCTRFFNQLIFEVRQLPRFIFSSGMSTSIDHVKVVFWHYGIEIRFIPLGVTSSLASLTILCRASDWQVSAMAQICTQFSVLLSTVEQLDIVSYNDSIFKDIMDDIDKMQWLELFQPFAAVRTLRISHHTQSLIVSALQELTGETATEVLPVLKDIHLDKHKPSRTEQQEIESFIAARQDSGHPVAIQRLENSRITEDWWD
jgi:hypothetical protein